ncbi:Protein disulfide-isomerase A6 [Orchesella cincta]|uniref:protein disulfide-isomerase n=1 Tax=Orchesella cincta TaxID=48709 RepID=A0A1D2NDN9_ORCCI|nr:Protein disulfide-isomerase A6 [Orchesella cincta]
MDKWRGLQLIPLLLALCATAQALYSSNSDVISLTSGNFDRLVKESDSVWIVEFFAPWCGHCKSLAPEYEKAAKALKGVVKVGAVDADQDKSLGNQYNIRGFPTIKIISGGKTEDYNGQRTAKGIVEAALKAARDKVDAQMNGRSSGGGSSGGSGSKKDVVELTDSNFQKLVLDSDEPWLVEFFAPWCGHCQRLEPEWAKAATELKGKVKVGALDATAHPGKASEYGVQGYPTIKFFPAGRKRSSDAEDYDGGRTADAIINWANDKATASMPPPELEQILNDDVLQEGCVKHSLCVVSVVPHILDCDAACRNRYLNILRANGEKYKRNQWGWLWAQAGDHLNLEEAIDIGGFGYPAMAVVSAKKGKYSLFRGSFSEEGIREFLRDLSYGKGSTAPIRGATLPKIDSVDPWDGKDGQLPQEESLLDLDDAFDDKDEL